MQINDVSQHEPPPRPGRSVRGLWFVLSFIVLGASILGGAAAFALHADTEGRRTDVDSGAGPGRWAQPRVDFEIRFAPDALLPRDLSMLRVSLDSDKGSIDADLEIGDMTASGAIIRGSVSITHRSENRLLVVHSPGEPDRVCQPRLARDPGTSEAYGAWLPCTEVFDPNATRARAPRPSEVADLRLKVWRPPVWRDAL